MNIIFAGTPEFAAVALKALHEAGHHIALVLSQPDQPAGRGMKPRPSAVTQYAHQHGLDLIQPRSLKLDAALPDRAADATHARQRLMATGADVMVVAAYGLILPQWVLDMPPLGCINIHASLLPRWRGAAPIHRAIEAGDAQTGITIMRMDAGLDTGDMIASRAIAIAADDTTATLHNKLARLGASLVTEALASPQDWVLQPQDSAAACYAHKIEKAEATVNWHLPAVQIERRIRAFNPFPGASTQLPICAGGEVVKLWRSGVSSMAASQQPPGTLLAVDDQGIHVQCGKDVLRLEVLQRPGGKRLAAADFLRGRPLAPGMRLGANTSCETA